MSLLHSGAPSFGDPVDGGAKVQKARRMRLTPDRHLVMGRLHRAVLEFVPSVFGLQQLLVSWSAKH